MSKQQSIRDELSEVLFRFYDHGTQPNAFVEADALLAAPVIRRIQAETLREAAAALTGDTSNLNPAHPVELAYINCTRIDAQELRHRADRIEKGEDA